MILLIEISERFGINKYSRRAGPNFDSFGELDYYAQSHFYMVEFNSVDRRGAFFGKKMSIQDMQAANYLRPLKWTDGAALMIFYLLVALPLSCHRLPHFLTTVTFPVTEKILLAPFSCRHLVFSLPFPSVRPISSWLSTPSSHRYKWPASTSLTHRESVEIY